ncbi:MAG: class IV adenylate cyclase [Bacteroidetes bacterium]|nr:class IV adenylate cyclase [Bacteroidota bacterium]
MPLNIEIKAQTDRIDEIRQILRDHNALEKGTDHQIDTYFYALNGRLKLREGNIENSLIHYQRPDQAGPKTSEVTLYRSQDTETLKTLLSNAFGVWKKVMKAREIFFIENVKFHLDTVKELGTFVEIEAIDKDGTIGKEKLMEQCQRYMELFQIRDEDLLEKSYSDMI